MANDSDDCNGVGNDNANDNDNESHRNTNTGTGGCFSYAAIRSARRRAEELPFRKDPGPTKCGAALDAAAPGAARLGELVAATAAVTS